MILQRKESNRKVGTLTGRSTMAWLIAVQAAAVAPVCTAFNETSTRKKNTAGIGSRT